MEDSYSKNYLKIYFWKVISIILNILSMFIVTPALTDNPAIYSIYAICISTKIFLRYSDLGFIKSGTKYASECLARGERKEEIKITAFSCFMPLLFLLSYSMILLIFVFNPALLILRKWELTIINWL